jgi:hypothetical protein
MKFPNDANDNAAKELVKFCLPKHNFDNETRKDRKNTFYQNEDTSKSNRNPFKDIGDTFKNDTSPYQRLGEWTKSQSLSSKT